MYLDPLPGAHNHLPEAQVLLDVFVKGLDGETLGVSLRHLGLGHVELVGDKEAVLVSEVRDEKSDPPHLRESYDLRGDQKPFLFGNPRPLVRKPPPRQKMNSNLDVIQGNVTVLFQGRQKSPTCFLNRIEDGRTRIPSIHDDGKALGEEKKGLLQDFQGEGDLAFESGRLRDLPRTIAPNRKDKTQGPGFEKCRHRTKTLLKPLG